MKTKINMVLSSYKLATTYIKRLLIYYTVCNETTQMWNKEKLKTLKTLPMSHAVEVLQSNVTYIRQAYHFVLHGSQCPLWENGGESGAMRVWDGEYCGDSDPPEDDDEE